MSFGNYLEDYITGVKLGRKPKIMKEYMANQRVMQDQAFQNEQIANQRRYNEKQAKDWGTQADTLYGMQAQDGQAGMYEGQHGPTKAGGIISSADAFLDAPNTPSMPSQTEVQAPQAPQEATNMFQGATPEQVRQYGLQKRAMQTGMIPGMTMQMGAVNPMQSSSMANEQSGLNNVANNQNAIQRQGMADRASMARTLATDPYSQYMDNPEKSEAFHQMKQDGKGNKDIFKDESALRKEYDAGNKNFDALRGQMANIRASYTVNEDTGLLDGTGPGDMGLITGFMKMLDPRSIVRETEYAQAQNTAGFFGKLEASLKKLESGTDLTSGQRTVLVNQMNKYWQATLDHMRKRKENYVGYANDYNFNPERVVGTITYDDPIERTKQSKPKAEVKKPIRVNDAEGFEPSMVNNLSPSATKVFDQMHAANSPRADIIEYVLSQQGNQ